jgi:hypothetical protein
VALRRTDYDRAAAARAVRASGYPMAQDFADRNILAPPSAAEALDVFEPLEATASPHAG